jgi:ADP-heptose:LPS heptosyltransferase
LKVLAIKLKLLGDVAVLVPALRALHEAWPGGELHVLVREEAVPVLENIPWIRRVWGVPKRLSWWGPGGIWARIREWRGVGFDRSVDFEGNDRGAILSRLIGAPVRLGSLAPRGFLGRRRCYTQTVGKRADGVHEVYRDLHTLGAWGIPGPSSLEGEVHPAPEWADYAESVLAERGGVVAHLSTSQPKKEWPVDCWAEVATRALERGVPMYFSSGVSVRERALLDALKRRVPGVVVLPAAPGLAAFIAVLSRAGVFVSGDTGPLHLAAGLGISTVGIFGPSDMGQWLPMARECEGLKGGACVCSGHARECGSETPCIRGVSVEAVWGKILDRYERVSSKR